MLSLGIGVVNCALRQVVASWPRIWAILSRPLLLLSCVFYLFQNIPMPYQGWLWWNPIVHLVGLMRGAFYPTYIADYASLLYVASVGGIALLIGLTILTLKEDFS